MKDLLLAVVQAALGGDRAHNNARIEELVREAAGRGAGFVVLPELFDGPYFCKGKDPRHFDLARPAGSHETVERFRRLAAELGLCLPVSFFERDGERFYNSVALIDGGGRIDGVYRKSHIPDGPGYEEKYYFEAGDSGFNVWSTKHGCAGVGICWDQWFPECARSLVLGGADFLVYPSAIGSEPEDPDLDTRGPWRRVMIGHAVANAVAVAAANRIGEEDGQVFYGNSFIADHKGEVLASLAEDEEGVAVARVDIAEVRRYRESFSLIGDRRPDLYQSLVGGQGVKTVKR
ncbi:MAG: nitrilase-related carbon-nitrogen hydrolase [Deltaproteobacteria bacterium]